MSDTMNQGVVAPWEPMNDFDEDHDMTDENAVATEELNVTPEKATLIDEIATEFVGFWNRLVSQTNWEKGKVINTWRTRLIEAGLPRSIYSDDSIAKRIGNVSGQHVGRLRRVYDQFGSSEQYPGLYWSHYQAALDWNDADEWLKRASAESLSVASMRIARWEKYGAPADRKPKESEIVIAEPDEDVNPYNDSDSAIIDVGVPIDDSTKEKKGKGEEKGDKRTDKSSSGSTAEFGGSDEVWSPDLSAGEVISSLVKMPELPADLADAFEELKIAILNHKVAKWNDVDPKTIMDYLGAMRALVLSKDS